jgi:uncharacterized membrane-anchored protein
LIRGETVDAAETAAALTLRAAVNIIVVDQMASHQLGEGRQNNLAPSAKTWPLPENSEDIAISTEDASLTETWPLGKKPGPFAKPHNFFLPRS